MWEKILETTMLVCFGAAWPFSIWRSFKSRTAKGKSIGFLLIVLAGYVAGIAKVIITDGLKGFLLIPYTINFCMVFCDTCLYFRNSRLDKTKSLQE